MGNFGSRLTGCGHLVPPARTRTIGHFQSYDRSGNRRADDRFQSAAAIGLRPRERDPSPKLPLTVLRPWSTSDGRCTSAVRSAEKALPTLSGSPSRRIRSRKPVRAGGGQKPAFSDPRGGVSARSPSLAIDALLLTFQPVDYCLGQGNPPVRIRVLAFEGNHSQ